MNILRAKNQIGPAFLYLVFASYLILTSSFHIVASWSWHDTQRASQIILLVLLWIIWFYIEPKSKFKTNFLICARIGGPIALFASFGLMSVLLAEYPRWALLEWSLILSLLIGVFFISDIKIAAEEEFDFYILGIIFVTCLIYFLRFVVDYCGAISGALLNTSNLFHGFSNIRFFGQFQTMTLPLLALFIFYANSSFKKIGAIGLLGSWWMLSLFFGTRGTWLGMFITVLVIFFIAGKAGRIWVRWQILGFILGLVLYGLFFLLIPDLLSVKAELINRLPHITSLSARDVLWNRSWEMIKEHFLLGVGPMHFATQPNGIGAHPHNSILQIAAEWGVPAMLLLLGSALFGLFRFSQMLRRAGQDATPQILLQVALFSSLVAAATQSLVDGVIVMPYSQTFLMLIIGWSVGSYSVSKYRVQQKVGSFGSTTIIAALSAILLGLVVLTALPEVLYLPEREKVFTAKYGNYFSPRFWRQGWIDQ